MNKTLENLKKCLEERKSLVEKFGKDSVWYAQMLELEEKINALVSRETVTIEVMYEEGYRWSVMIQGEEEGSRESGLTKADAMALARYIKRVEFNGKAKIVAETLSKKEKADNMRNLWEQGVYYDNCLKN